MHHHHTLTTHLQTALEHAQRLEEIAKLDADTPAARLYNTVAWRLLLLIESLKDEALVHLRETA